MYGDPGKSSRSPMTWVSGALDLSAASFPKLDLKMRNILYHELTRWTNCLCQARLALLLKPSFESIVGHETLPPFFRRLRGLSDQETSHQAFHWDGT
jgi:hypothetical protein